MIKKFYLFLCESPLSILFPLLLKVGVDLTIERKRYRFDGRKELRKEKNIKRILAIS